MSKSSKYRSRLAEDATASNKYVVRSSKESFIKGIKDYSTMRQQHDSRSGGSSATVKKQPRSGSKTTSVSKTINTATAKSGKTGSGSKSADKKDARGKSSTKKAQKKR